MPFVWPLSTEMQVHRWPLPGRLQTRKSLSAEAVTIRWLPSRMTWEHGMVDNDYKRPLCTNKYHAEGRNDTTRQQPCRTHLQRCYGGAVSCQRGHVCPFEGPQLHHAVKGARNHQLRRHRVECIHCELVPTKSVAHGDADYLLP